RLERRREARLLEHLRAVAGKRWIPGDRHRNHARDVRGCLIDRDALLQARDPLIAEVAEKGFVGIELQRTDQRGLAIEETKSLRHHADDVGWPAVDEQLLADDRRVAAEL